MNHCSISRRESDHINQLLAHKFGCELADTTGSRRKNIAWRFVDWVKAQASRFVTKKFRVVAVCSHYYNSWEAAAVSETIMSLRRALGDRYEIESTLLSAENHPETFKNSVLKHLRKHQHEYDVCITFNSWVAVGLKDGLSVQVRRNMPVVFGGLADLDLLGLVDDDGLCHEGMTGVEMSVPSYSEQVKALLQLKPDLTHMVVPTDIDLSHGTFAEYSYGPTRAFARSWRLTGRRVRVVRVNRGDNIARAIMNNVTPGCMVNLSLQSSVQVQARHIVHACGEYGVPVYGHSRQAVRQGAALGSGNTGEAYGPSMASTIIDVCLRDIEPRHIDRLQVDEQSSVCYLEPALEGQGIVVDDDTLRAMRMLPIQHTV